MEIDNRLPISSFGSYSQDNSPLLTDKTTFRKHLYQARQTEKVKSKCITNLPESHCCDLLVVLDISGRSSLSLDSLKHSLPSKINSSKFKSKFNTDTDSEYSGSENITSNENSSEKRRCSRTPDSLTSPATSGIFDCDTKQVADAKEFAVPCLAEKLSWSYYWLTDESLENKPQIYSLTLPNNVEALSKTLKKFVQKIQTEYNAVKPNSSYSVSIACFGGENIRQKLHGAAAQVGYRPLPRIFHTYFDLQRYFRQAYPLLGESSFDQVVSKLGIEFDTLPSEHSVQDAAKRIQIYHRLIKNCISRKKKFRVVERINTHLESVQPVLGENSVPDDTVVRLRGLPWQCSDHDVSNFFAGLNIPRGGVVLLLTNTGRRSGEALVRFETREQREMALSRHREPMGNRYIEVFKAYSHDFVSVAGEPSAEATDFMRKRENAAVVRLRGLPYSCCEADVVNFFERAEHDQEIGVRPMEGEKGILMIRRGFQNNPTGDAFVLFYDSNDAALALKKHRAEIDDVQIVADEDGVESELVRRRYVEVFRSTAAELHQVVSRQNMSAHMIPIQQSQQFTNGLLDPSATNFVPQFNHPPPSLFSTPTSQHQAISAAQQQQNTYGNNQQQFAQQMAAQMQIQNSLLNGGFIDPNAMVFNNAMVENYGYENQKNQHNGYKNRNNGYYNKNRNYNKNGYENNKFRNNHNKNQNYRNSGEGNSFGQGAPRFKKNHHHNQKPPLENKSNQPGLLPSNQQVATASAAACTVGVTGTPAGSVRNCIRLRGMPYSATIDQIMDFLGEIGFCIQQHGIHMVLNPQGRPSGDAFIQMQNVENASQAAQDVNKGGCHKKHMGDRYVEVFQCSVDEMNLVLLGGTLNRNGLQPPPGMTLINASELASATYWPTSTNVVALAGAATGIQSDFAMAMMNQQSMPFNNFRMNVSPASLNNFQYNGFQNQKSSPTTPTSPTNQPLLPHPLSGLQTYNNVPMTQNLGYNFTPGSASHPTTTGHAQEVNKVEDSNLADDNGKEDTQKDTSNIENDKQE